MQFADILKGAKAEGKEKHVPIIELMKEHGSAKLDLIHVMVGKETPHPNTVEHHIAWVEVFGVKKDTGQVISLGRAVFGPSFTSPNISLHTPLEQFKAICALSYCNVHGLW
ncbi:MAG: desulfoferrodoxin family protein, partial [Dehalococcoidia bacterium]